MGLIEDYATEKTSPFGLAALKALEEELRQIDEAKAAYESRKDGINLIAKVLDKKITLI